MAGKALSTFMQSRVGLCVLHPIRELAGTKCIVEHPDGSLTEHEFPLYVSPHQPFKNVMSIRHAVDPSIDAIVRFRGGVFETEDQRNWSDGSYKTYSPPLDIPFPSEMQGGSQLCQSVRIELVPANVRRGYSLNSSRDVGLHIAKAVGTVPKVGLCFEPENAPLTADQLHLLDLLRLDHLRVDLNMTDARFTGNLGQAWTESKALGAGLEIALSFTDGMEEELQRLLDTLVRVKPEVRSWLLCETPAHRIDSETISTLRKFLSQYDKKSVILAGTSANFAELNRSQVLATQVDGSCSGRHLSGQ